MAHAEEPFDWYAVTREKGRAGAAARLEELDE